MILLIFASIIWVPIGVWIGMNPRVSRLAQPVVQVLASFPANFLFPFAAAFFVATGLSLNVGGILLMALGAQWYILFNVIAGALAIPSDLRSTFLRCIAGLIAPSTGTVTYRGTPLNGANPGVAMVFQSFALLPWLTVQQGVELAMQARERPEQQRHARRCTSST